MDRSSESLPCPGAFVLGDDVENHAPTRRAKASRIDSMRTRSSGEVAARSGANHASCRAPCRAANEPNERDQP